MDAEVGRRIRAARAYADIRQPALAARLGVSRDTIYRLEKGGRQLRPLEDEEALLGRIAELCGLPAAFFSVDFSELDMLATAHDREMLAAEVSHPTQHEGLADVEVAVELRAVRAQLDHLINQLPGDGEEIEDELAAGAEELAREVEQQPPGSERTRAGRARRGAG